MNLIVKIGGVDKSEVIDWPSFTIEDNIDEQPDICSFSIQKHAGQTYSPSVNDEVEVKAVNGENEIKNIVGTEESVGSRDLANAFTNSSALSTTWGKIGTITPAERLHITRLGVYVNVKGTGNWAVKILKTSDSSLMAQSSTKGADGEGVNANMPASGWKYFTQNCILEPGVAYDLYIYNSTSDGTIKSQTTNTLLTASYNLLRAKRVAEFDVIANGVTTPLIANNELEGVLHGSIFNLDNATYSLPVMSLSGSSGADALNRSNVYTSRNSVSGAYYNYLQIHGTGVYDIMLGGAGAELVYRVDTIFPARAVRVTGPNYGSGRTYSMDYSFDGTNWVNVIRNATASGTIMNFDALGNRIFYVKIYKHTTDGTGANYLSTFSISADLNLSGIDGKVFGGRVLSVSNSIEGEMSNFAVTCKDYTAELDRILVTDSFSNTTVGAIIEYICANYLPEITYNNVVCTIPVSKIVFNKMAVSKCISELAKLVNYSWYIDYDRDIHFFVKNTEVAPYSINDTSTDIIADSLRLDNDLSQLRNVVIIRGGEKVATNTRTKNHTANGIITTFNTDFKFANKPVVKVNAVEVTVGVENLDTTGFDCYWDYNQKYIRFDVAPTDTHEIEIIGYPLIPIIAQVEDLDSISKYGRFEFAKTDKTIKSSDEAKLYGEAQLNAYGNSIREGSFRTYTGGARSGQSISISNTSLGVSEVFIIQRVTLGMISRTKGEWSIELATLKTIGIIQFLQNQLLSDNKKIDFNEDDVLEKYYMDNQTVAVTEQVGLEAITHDDVEIEVGEDIAIMDEVEFVLCPYTPTGGDDPKREFCLDRGLLS